MGDRGCVEVEVRQLAPDEGSAGADRRLTLLARASSLLAAELDYGATLQEAARLAVPLLADWCTIDVLDERGEVRRVATAHVDPAMEKLVRDLAEQFPFRPDEPRAVSTVLRTGQAQLQHDISDEELRTSARDERHLAIMRSLLPRSAMTVPLIARGHGVGVLSLTLGDSERRYTADDLPLAEDLAGYAALALDNARLYDEARRAEAKLSALNAELESRVQARTAELASVVNELERASQARSAFIANVSHELRTPLNAILGFSELLLDIPEGRADPAKTRSFLQVIHSNGQHLLGLINGILDISKVEAGKIDLRPAPFDLGELVVGTLTAVEALARRKSIVLTADAAGVGELVADEVKVKQILLNLLSNAIKFTPDGGSVTVRVRRKAGEVVLSVEDTGIGIAREHHELIFREFQQVEGGAGVRHEGTGLGLALVKRFAELHGGRVWVESAPGVGSRFHVALPIGEPTVS